KTPEEVIGFTKNRTEPWFSDEVLNLSDKRRTIKAKMSIIPHGPQTEKYTAEEQQ
ncbi:hypothetical protein ACJMK2_008768, partial [Sinanodonta woodiana]